MPPHQPVGFMESFSDIRNKRQDHSDSEMILPGWYQEKYQAIMKKTPQSQMSTSMDTEQKWQLQKDMNQEQRAMYIHQGITNETNYFLTQVMPWTMTDKIYHKFKMYILDFNDIKVIPYAAWGGQVTSSARESHFRLQRYNHGLSIDATQLSEMSAPEGLEHVEHLFRQLFLDIRTAATMVGLAALMGTEDSDKYYKSCNMDWKSDQEAALRQHKNMWLSFAKRKHGTNEFYPYLSLGKKVISSKKYTANILIMPEDSEGLIVKNVIPREVYIWSWDERQSKMSQVETKERLDVIPGQEQIQVYAAPRVELFHYQKRYKEGSFRVQQETTTVSEWCEMDSRYMCAETSNFCSEFLDIELWSYNDDKWSKVSFLHAFENCKFFHKSEHTGDLHWHPNFIKWLETTHLKDDKSDGHKCIFASGHGREPIQYLGEIRMGSGCDAVDEKAFMHMAKGVCMKLNRMNNADLDSVINEGITILNSIADAGYNKVFFEQMIALNSKVVSDPAEKPKFVTERNLRNLAATNIPEFVQNELGSLVIPSKKGIGLPSVPPSLLTLSAVQELAKHALDEESYYQPLGQRLMNFSQKFNSLSINLKNMLPSSILNDSDNISGWIHSENTGNILLRALLPEQKTCLFMKTKTTNQAVAPASLTEQYKEVLDDKKVKAKWDDLFTNPDKKSKVLAFVAKKQSTKNFDALRFLRTAEEREIMALKDAKESDEEDKILERIFDGYAKVVVIYNRSKKNKKDETDEKPKERKFSSSPDGWARTPLVATRGILMSLKNVDDPLVLPADPNRNQETFVQKGDIKDVFSYIGRPQQEKEEWVSSINEALEIAIKRPVTKVSYDFIPKETKSIDDMFSFSDEKKNHMDHHHHEETHQMRWYTNTMKMNIQRCMDSYSPFPRLCALALLFSTNVPSTLQKLIKHDCMVSIIKILLFRPAVTHKTSAPILVATGANGDPDSQPLGGIYYINGYPIESLDHSMKWRFDFNFHMGAFVRDPNRVFVFHDAVPNRIVSGCNVNFYDEMDHATLFDNIQTDDHDGTIGSLFPVVVSSQYQPKKDIIHLCTAYVQSSHNIVPCGFYFDEHVGFFSETKRKITGTEYDSNPFGLAMRVTCYRMDAKSNQWTYRDVGTSHNSELYQNNGAKFFRGEEAKYDPDHTK